MIIDSPEARSVVGRFQRAKNTLQELVNRSAPKAVITLARLNVAHLSAMIALLPRKQAA